MRDDIEGEGSRANMAGLVEESSSGSSSSKDRLKGQEQSKRKEDPTRWRSAERVDGGNRKGVVLEMGMGEYSIRHRCTFELICALQISSPARYATFPLS